MSLWDRAKKVLGIKAGAAIEHGPPGPRPEKVNAQRQPMVGFERKPQGPTPDAPRTPHVAGVLPPGGRSANPFRRAAPSQPPHLAASPSSGPRTVPAPRANHRDQLPQPSMRASPTSSVDTGIRHSGGNPFQRAAGTTAAIPVPPAAFIEWVKSDGVEVAMKARFAVEAKPAWRTAKATFVSNSQSPAHKCWRIHAGRVPLLLETLGELFPVWPFAQSLDDIQTLVDQAVRTPEAGLFCDDLQVTIYPARADIAPTPTESEDDEDGDACIEVDALVIRAPYHAGVNRLITSMGGRFSPASKSWVIYRSSPSFFVQRLTENYPIQADRVHVMEGDYRLHQGLSLGKTDFTISLGDSADAGNRGARAEAGDPGSLLANIPPRGLGPVPLQQVEACLRSYEIDDYQAVGVKHLLRFNSSLLADDMGLGKTRQGVVAADIARKGGRVLIIAPASLLLNWEREIRMVIANPGAISIAMADPDAPWQIVSFNGVVAAEKDAARYRVVLVDEAHNVKNPASERTRHTFSVCQAIPNRYILTGTPLLNCEDEVHTLLRLSGHPIGSTPLRQFRREYAGGADFRRRLHRELDDWMLRRDKATVLTLQGKRRDICNIGLSPRGMEEYRGVATSLDLTGLQKLGKLRQILERSKSEYILERIASRAPGDKFIIFAEHHESIDHLSQSLTRQRIKHVTYTGKHTKRRRQNVVDQFQTDPECLVFLGMTSAAGVGITLTAANRVLFSGMPWTMAMMDQAEDRANRRGQTKLVRSEVILARDTIDESLLRLIEHKGGLSEEVVIGRFADALADNEEAIDDAAAA